MLCSRLPIGIVAVLLAHAGCTSAGSSHSNPSDTVADRVAPDSPAPELGTDLASSDLGAETDSSPADTWTKRDANDDAERQSGDCRSCDQFADIDGTAMPDGPVAADSEFADLGAPDQETASDSTVDVEYIGEPLAWVWTDPNQVYQADPEEVLLPHLNDPAGKLTGDYANVTNCLNKPGGIETTMDFNGQPVTIALCVFEQTSQPGPDGTYLHIRPPENPKDPNDPYAEVQMYYHMNRIHDYFQQTHGFSGMDRSLKAVVNLQVAITIFSTAWMAIDNAAYMPQESIEQLGNLIGVEPPLHEDAIIFAQGPTADMSYDGDVIYHEYTHAVVGSDRLLGVRADKYGADMAPISLNEGHADYFTAALTDDSVIGGWSLGALDAARDLTVARRCPQDLIGESHEDGLIFSTALWQIRQALGPEAADAIVFDALLGYGSMTGFDEAAESVIANAAALQPSRADEVAAIFAAHGLPDCNRVKDLSDPNTGATVFIPGTETTGQLAFRQVAPAYAQFSFEVPAGTTYATLQWQRQPDPVSQLSSLMGQVPETVEVDVALKPGADPILWTYGPEGAQHDAPSLLAATREGDNYSLVLSGSCLSPGRHTLQYVNSSQAGAIMADLVVTTSDQPLPADLPVQPYDCDG